MKLPIFQVDAFAERLFTGNPAAVVPLESWLDAEIMQQIAAENNLAETAFFVPSDRDDADYDLRWFTPAAEVDLCGHATLASAHVLFEQLGFGAERVRFHTRSGVLIVQLKDSKLWLDMPALEVSPIEITDAMEQSLGVRPLEAYDGMYQILVLDSEKTIRAIKPDFRTITALHKDAVAITAPGEKHDFVSRLFAPNFAIDEDPVTGSLHAILTPLWAKKLARNQLRARQTSPRGGDLQCILSDDATRVRVGGNAITYLKGEINI